MKKIKLVLLIICGLAAVSYAYWKLVIPAHRVNFQSELIMLGDLDNDNRWSQKDLNVLEAFLNDPFATPDSTVFRIDINQNGFVDKNDLAIIHALIDSKGDPYIASANANAGGVLFPQPRECYRYASVREYRPRPLWALPYPLAKSSDIDWLVKLHPAVTGISYADALNSAIYSEAVRLDQAWRKRKPELLPIERDYAKRKFTHAKSLFNSGKRYELLLALIEMVEDAETLSVRNQPEIYTKMLVFRDHLRNLLNSGLYTDFKAGKKDWQAVLKSVSIYLKEDLNLTYDFEKLAPPRNFTNLENYLLRAEWQYYKSSTVKEDFVKLIGYAQHDPRYLRAVARTSRRHQDINVENHNLAMVLLFREALRIKNGDKKKAIGLLDEAIRIPYAWIRSIPRELLPSSVALDNFLLPGNKEDGSDKSRHWNVFGGICIYNSPQEALDIALKRELQDLKRDGYSEEAMREFIRDMIANINGMYHVMCINEMMP